MSEADGRAEISALKPHYRTGRDELGRDFFVPCLRWCTAYRRAAGFFSSSVLATWADILPRLVRDEVAKIYLLISPHLSHSDREALERATTPDERLRILQDSADRIVLDALEFATTPRNVSLRGKLLAWFVATERLELRFAFAEHTGVATLFHEKIGIFDFPWGARVAFTGSANESEAGHVMNFETLDVFRNWVPEDAERVRTKISQFEEAWSGTAPGLRVVGLSEDAIKAVVAHAPDRPPGEGGTESPAAHQAPNRWRHQGEAIEAFFKTGRGVLNMATGTGKTRTALHICERLVRAREIDTVIVAADGNDLLDQWFLQLLDLTPHLPQQFSILRHHGTHHERDYFLVEPRRRILLISRPAVPPALRGLTRDAAVRTLLIHDEVHRLGSPANRLALAGLSDNIRYRLGLSATPEREYDAEGNEFIENHIGPVVFTFGLEDAIRRGILTPFTYWPIEYFANADDKERIRLVWSRASARQREGRPMSQEEIWIELAKVHKTSRAKLPLFAKFIRSRPELLERCIIFVETQEYGDKVLQIVHELRADFHTYFAEEDSATLDRFARGDIECLLTCHRLSEGIDIKSLRNVVLFSSARARLETIQRMGRCLRVDPTNPVKRANVVDFVRIPESDERDDLLGADAERRAWLASLADVTPEE